MLALASLLALAAAPAATPAVSEAPARYLVVVGYNGGLPDPRTPLHFADDDAARTFLQLAPSAERAWLLSTADRETAKLFPDLTDVAREPTRQALAQALGEAFWLMRQQRARGRATELVFSFAGHGDVNDAGEGYVVLADGPFTRTDLTTQVLEASPADINHVVIDACSSYFMVNARGGDSGVQSGRVELSPKLLDVLSQQLDAAVRARTGILVSTSGAAEVHESGELGAGVFSFLLRSALAGGADGDSDGRVEYAEAAAFVAAASANLDDPRARLSVHVEAPLQKPHSALLDLSRSGADRFLALDERGPLHLRILDAHGLPYAEVHDAGRDKPVVLALVGNPFFIVQKGAQEAVLVPRSAGAYALSTLEFHDSPRARADVPGAFAGLYAGSFSPEFMQGFLATASSGAALAPPRTDAAFIPAWAEAGRPHARLPVGVIGFTTLGGAALFGLSAGGAAVANQLAFTRLEQDFRTTGQLDPAIALEVEGWRNATNAFTVGAVALGLAGGALVLWSMQLPEGEVALPW